MDNNYPTTNISSHNVAPIQHSNAIRGEVLPPIDEKQINRYFDQAESVLTRYWALEKELHSARINEEKKIFELACEKRKILQLQQDALNYINSSGLCLWKNLKNNQIFFKSNVQSEPIYGSQEKISTYLSEKFGRKIKIVFDFDKIDSNPVVNDTIYIFTCGMTTIDDEVYHPEFFSIHNPGFNQFMPYDFFQEGTQIFRNLFQPTNYLLQKFFYFKHPLQNSIIHDFIFQMVGENNKTSNYIIDWLASFYQTMKKPPTLLIFIGDKKVSNEIFIEEILKPIFGAKNFLMIDKKILETQNNKEFCNRLFYHIDETFSKEEQNLLEDLKKYIKRMLFQNLNEQVVHGQALITSDNPYPFVKDFYSKCVVIEIQYLQKILEKLSLADSLELSIQIQNDLGNFSHLLKAHFVSIFSTFQAIDTKQKTDLQKTERDKFLEFIEALEKKDLTFFDKVKYENSEAYEDLVQFFTEDLIKQSDLYIYINILYKEYCFTDNKTLIPKLKELSPIFKQEAKNRIKNVKTYKLSNYEELPIAENENL